MPEEILNNVYDITLSDELGRLRVYLFNVCTPTLIDTTYHKHVSQLEKGINKIGVEPERLIITHEDPDHVEAIEKIVDQYDLETWVPKKSQSLRDINPDHLVEDGDQIGNFKAISLPGHTPGSTAYLDEEASILVAGDAVVGSDWRGLPPGYLITPPEVFTEDLHSAERTLDKLLEYEFDTVLVYHGSSVFEDADQKLDSYLNFPGRPD